MSNRYTAADRLSCQSKVKDEDKDEKDINEFINLQLNIIRISDMILKELEKEVLETEYTLKHQ